MKKCAAYILTIVMLLTAFPLTVFASGEAREKVIRLGYYEAPGMMDGASADAHKSGYAYEYLQLLYNISGYSYEYVYGDFDELMNKLMNGEIDAMADISYTKERAGKLLFPELPMGYESGYLARLLDKNAEEAYGIASLDGAKVGISEGVFQNQAFEDYVSENNLKVEIISYKSSAEKWDALRDGIIDYTVDTDLSSPKDLVSVMEFDTAPVYIALAKGREDLLAELNKSQQDVADNYGQYLNELNDKYFYDSPIKRKLDDDELSYLKAHGTIKVGGFSGYAPYSFEGEEGAAEGFSVRFLEELFASFGIDRDFEWKLYDTIGELHEALAKGEIDVISAEYHSYNYAEENNSLISASYFPVKMMMLKGRKLGDDEQLRIATGTNGIGAMYVRDFYPESVIIGCNDVEDCINRVIMGEADCAVAPSSMLIAKAEKYAESGEYMLENMTEECSICFSCRPEDYELIKILNKGISLIDNASISNMLADYTAISSEGQISLYQFIVNHLAATAIFFILFIALICTLVAQSIYSKRKRVHLEKIISQKEAIEQKTRELNETKQNLTKLNLMFEEAILKDSCGYFRANLTENRLILPLIGIENGKQTDVTDSNYSSLSYDEFILAFIDGFVDDNYGETFKRAQMSGELIRRFLQGSSVVEHEFKIIEPGKEPYYRRHVSYMSQDENTGDILALNVAYIVNDVEGSREHIKMLNQTLEENKKTLEKALKRAEEANETKTRFLSNMSHEIRTPMNAIIGYLSLARTHLDDKERAEEYLKNAETVGLQLRELVDLILDMRRIESGDVSIEDKLSFKLKLKSSDNLSEEVAKEDFWNDSFDGVLDYDFKGRRVLVVEDNELNREIAKEVLFDIGITVTEAYNGEAAVDIMKEAKPGDFDLILMDIRMPGMDGYEATRAIRALNDYCASVPIVAMTAQAFEEDRKMALQSGMNDHLAKPIDVEKLKVVMAGLMDGSIN